MAQQGRVWREIDVGWDLVFADVDLKPLLQRKDGQFLAMDD